ncbi:MAG: hypothetical protein HY064_08525 [Bacteroidetes bacterium]|nr:hypothetical protein [Bacteroidota bacterium]
MKKNFRSISTILFTAGLLFSSCHNAGKKTAANRMSDSLIVQTQRKDSAIDAYIQTLNEIDLNLDQIRDKRGLIVMGPKSNVAENVSKKEQILRNLSMIDMMLASNKEKITKLETDLSKSNSGDKKLAALVKSYRARIAESDSETADLKKQLASLSFTNEELKTNVKNMQTDNDKLQGENSGLHENVSTMDRELHTAYYAVGTYKNLKSEKIIPKNDVLGIETTPIPGPGFNASSFAEINTKTTTDIMVNSKKVKIMTDHPAESYSIVKDPDGTLTIHIIDPDLFWSISKYLVVETRV